MVPKYYTETASFIGLGSNYDFLGDILRNGILLKKVMIKLELIVYQPDLTLNRSALYNPIDSYLNFFVFFRRNLEPIISYQQGGATSSGVINSFDVESNSLISVPNSPFTIYQDIQRFNLTKTLSFNQIISGINPIAIQTSFYNPPPGGGIEATYNVSAYIDFNFKRKEDESLYG